MISQFYYTITVLVCLFSYHSLARADYTEVSAGYDSSCGLKDDGTVDCWGRNNFGQLGTGDTLDSPSPIATASFAGDVEKIALGAAYGCALLRDGTAQCWGYNDYGQLGDGTRNDSLVPINVAGLSGPAADLSAGYFHACALLIDQTVQCWGNNDNGQLGNSTTSDHSSIPVSVIDLAGPVVSLTGGYNHTCALLEDETVQCWGNNYYGQLGNGLSPADSSTPATVIDLAGPVVNVSGGLNHTCAVLADGSVQCWGRNNYGQLGDGTSGSDSSIPVSVTGLSGPALTVEGGYAHTCAVLVDGMVECWGYNHYGELGDGSTDQDSSTADYSLTPVSVTGLAGSVESLSLGFLFHGCALLTDGAIQCWGWNQFGQLGNGEAGETHSPYVKGELSDSLDVAVGYWFLCGLSSDGSVQCAGHNYSGQQGNDTTSDYSSSWGEVSGLAGPAEQIVAGSDHVCALLSDGTVQCWGYNALGQLGNGTTDSSVSTPVTVTGLSAPATNLVAGVHHTCAILEDGSVQCWGFNRSGQLGNGTRSFSISTPVTVTGLVGPAVDLAASYEHTCAVITDGALQCWGSNFSNQLGDGTGASSSVPVNVNGLSGSAIKVTAGYNHTCALLEDGEVQCWGLNSYGQLGIGTAPRASTPTSVSYLTETVVDVSATGDSTCALLDEGSVWCWGLNENGQLGNGTTTNAVRPVHVFGPCQISTLSEESSGLGVCALTDSGQVSCWGTLSNAVYETTPVMLATADSFGIPWYIDRDADGYGSSSLSMTACRQPTNYVSNADDCNDWTGRVNPGAGEFCGNGYDENCNGLIDEDECGR